MTRKKAKAKGRARGSVLPREGRGRDGELRVRGDGCVSVWLTPRELWLLAEACTGADDDVPDHERDEDDVDVAKLAQRLGALHAELAGPADDEEEDDDAGTCVACGAELEEDEDDCPACGDDQESDDEDDGDDEDDDDDQDDEEEDDEDE